MGFDPNAFTLQLIQGLGSQIQQGRQQAREQAVLDELIPQLRQAQDPQSILNLIAEAQTRPGLRPEARDQFVKTATPAFNLARDQLKKREDQSKKVLDAEVELEQKSALAELIRQSGGKVSDEQAAKLPIKSLEKQLEKQLQLGKEQKSKTFKDNSTFANKLYAEERKSFDQARLIKQARDASANFTQAAGALGKAFPALKGDSQAKFDSSVGLLIENFTRLFPGRISDIKFKFLQTLLPLASQRKEVRDALLDVLQDMAEAPALQAQVLRNIQSDDPEALEDPNLQNRLNQDLAIKFGEIDSKLDELNQFGNEVQQDQQGQLTPEERAELIRRLSAP